MLKVETMSVSMYFDASTISKEGGGGIMIATHQKVKNSLTFH